jgi:predicted benzoate:H+ symporter BenE
MVGANLVAGVLMIALGLLGVGVRIMAWLPLPIVSLADPRQLP